MPMPTTREIRTTHHDWIAKWYGGPYIEVFWAGRPDQALDVINVWDYEADRHTLSKFTSDHRAQVRTLLREWVRECADDYLRNAVPYM